MSQNSVSNIWQGSENIISKYDCDRLTKELFDNFSKFVKNEQIEDDLYHQLKSVYIPLTAWVIQKHNSQNNKPIVIGINGAQGSGKSTLSKILHLLLIEGFGKSVVHLSIDDLYLTRAHRRKLAKTVHPLLKTRGVPGTHDVELGIQLLSTLINGNIGNQVQIPVFDKAMDDLLPVTQWVRIASPVDIILFEGWCVGSIPQNQHDLLVDINDLERDDDKCKTWRSYVNQQLAGAYQDLFSYIDHLIMLQVPDMESVFEWRLKQEYKLREEKLEQGKETDNIMTEQEVANFIMYFERITRHTLSELPGRADILLKINKNHQIFAVEQKA